jgi:hypothetical protein
MLKSVMTGCFQTPSSGLSCSGRTGATRRSAAPPLWATATQSQQVSGDAPRAVNAMRLSVAAPALHDGRALLAARATYPPFEAGGAPRETGTIWLLRAGSDGEWRVLSARRLEAME